MVQLLGELSGGTETENTALRAASAPGRWPGHIRAVWRKKKKAATEKEGS